MRTIHASALLLAVMFIATPVFSQEVERQGQRYVFVGVGAWPAELGPDPLLSVGGGGEKRVKGGFGLGGEVQGFAQLYFGGGFYGGGVLSANGTYHFTRKANASAKLVPFATGGFSTVILCAGGCWPTIGYNFGGGVDYWRTADRGLRLEFRDTVTKDYGATHLWEIRTGFSF